jgi:uncharacterized membrane protein YgcG
MKTLPLRRRSLRHAFELAAALLALAMAVFVALPASAGPLHTTDDAGVLSASQLSGLRSRVAGYDFDVRLITTSSYLSKSDLGNYVHRFVTEPNIVVIGLDTEHRHVSVHFGTGTRIADSEFKAIESAGISYFKDGNWNGGVTAILDRAERAVGTTAATRGVAPVSAPVGAPASVPSRGVGFVGILFWIVLIGGVIGVLSWIFGRRAYGGGYGAGYVSSQPGYVPPQPGYGPVYGAPPPTPYYGGGSGIGSNIASAGIGGLIGYELGKEVGEGHNHPHYQGDYGPQGGYGDYPEPPPPPPPAWDGGGDSGQAGNFDAGGSSGGWDDSGSGSSGDSGGGGDSGGSGDADF